MAKLYVVGIGPGGLNHMTRQRGRHLPAAVVVGYQTYLDFITPLLAGKEVVSSGMMKEVERCSGAASGCRREGVALVSSGDAGIYGMAGLVLELVEAAAVQTEAASPAPGGRGRHRPGGFRSPGGSRGTRRTAHARFCRDLPLRPDDPVGAIDRRLPAAAECRFRYRPLQPPQQRAGSTARRGAADSPGARSATTPVGIVRNACRDGEEKVITTLADAGA